MKLYIPQALRATTPTIQKAMDRAMQGGIDDVGIGVLYGLEHYKYDFVGLLMR